MRKNVPMSHVPLSRFIVLGNKNCRFPFEETAIVCQAKDA